MNSKQMPEFFYCYSPNLFVYLHTNKKIKYICTGLNENNKRKFWQYKNTPEFIAAFNEYKSLNGMNGCNFPV